MRSDPADYELVAPASLGAALALLAGQPKEWLPIAGGTDVMVQFAAGTLGARKLLSIWNLPELRRIDVLPDEIQIGASSTYTDLRRNETIAREFALLASAASWTGSVANQNRGTLGGNIVNASPAADSLPALLAYEAELILVSGRGERRVAYVDFHTGYKTMRLAPDELIRAVCLPRRFAGYISYARKVGGRNAQAISKVCIAALGRIENGLVEDVRIALGSVAPVPIRLRQTEQALRGKRLDATSAALARQTAVAEARPIDDIRSTARYRAAIVSNFVGEFLENSVRRQEMCSVLARWNGLALAEAEEEIVSCCGSRAWAREMASRRPIPDEAALLSASDEACRMLGDHDWTEAFQSHPRIGETRAERTVDARAAAWSAKEQSGVGNGDDAANGAKAALAEGNREYERRFGRIFIVCASGKSAAEILEILQRRLQNDRVTEFREAAEQQRQITRIRLRTWMTP